MNLKPASSRKQDGSPPSMASHKPPWPISRQSTLSTILSNSTPAAWAFWRAITLKNAATWPSPWSRLDWSILAVIFRKNFATMVGKKTKRKLLDRTYDPVRQIFDKDNQPLFVQVPLFDPPLRVQVWRADIGRVPVYLLDTDVEGNQDSDRSITHRLYTNDPEQRLRQEIVLGMGGIRVLEALGFAPRPSILMKAIQPSHWSNACACLVEAGKTFDEAIAEVRDTSVFTTHTPVPAGTDVFPYPLMDKYFGNSYDKLGTNREGFLSLGANPVDPNAGFNMTVFSLRMAKFCNAVSKKHGEVARHMWAPLWPDKKEAGRTDHRSNQRSAPAYLDGPHMVAAYAR